ncbi:MAG: methylmalonyl-CoA epimerase [Ignavibacteriales bacterium]|nr:methylmalonyl-CoA epimerase [Ignavibacteriales bacterium]
MFEKISHIGIAVRDIEASTALFQKIFGKGPDHAEDLDGHKLRIAMFTVGTSAIELTQALDPESPVAMFIAKRGEGVHHVSFAVDDIEAELARLKAAGFQLIDEQSRPGADGYQVAFLHPKSTNGVLIEISQKLAG